MASSLDEVRRLVPIVDPVLFFAGQFDFLDTHARQQRLKTEPRFRNCTLQRRANRSLQCRWPENSLRVWGSAPGAEAG